MALPARRTYPCRMNSDKTAAYAARHATDDPDVFLIPAAQLPPGFAERIEAGQTPVAPRLAATAVLMRDAEQGPEALLVQRHGRSGFAAGAWVFPGGAVDPEDGTPAAAAIRETHEETGIQIAGELLPIARWITPEPELRRFDAWFFLARVPEGASLQLSAAEITEARWLRPAAAVEEFRARTLKMLPPTVHTLRRLAAFASVDEAWNALRNAPVPTVLPRMRRHPEGVTIEIPAVG